MERFWEFWFDTIVLLLKVIAIFIALRVLAMIFGVVLYVPYFDDIAYRLFDWIVYQLNRF